MPDFSKTISVSQRSSFFLALLSGVVLGIASLFPDSWKAVVFASVASFGMVLLFSVSQKKSRHFFALGAMFSTTAFYWLPSTITLFGGFPSPLAYLVFALFVATSALQFSLVAKCAEKFAPRSGSSWWVFPVFWLAGEAFFPRLFPWGLGHNFLAWRSFAALASVVGSFSLSFLILSWFSFAYHFFRGRSPKHFGIGVFWLTVLLIAPLTLGVFRHGQVLREAEQAPRVSFGVAQGNIGAWDGSNPKLLGENLAVYQQLSNSAKSAGAEILVWPESVMSTWTPTEYRGQTLQGTRFDPFPGGAVRLLYGGMTYEEKSAEEILRLRRSGSLVSRDDEYEKYNSAIALDASRVVGMYHKRALMPFGEYLPFSDLFPWIRSLSPMSGNLSAGKIVSPVFFPEVKERAVPEVRAGVLICYEDLVGRLSREYAFLDANVFVNLTNDAWYGHSHAQRQHSMLAAWRAVEGSKSLIRATNTGYSVVYGPRGETLATIPMYQPGFAVASVPLLSSQSPYVRWGDSFQWAILGLGFLFLVRSRRLRLDSPKIS